MSDTRTENQIEAINDNPFGLEPPDENEELAAVADMPALTADELAHLNDLYTHDFYLETAAVA